MNADAVALPQLFRVHVHGLTWFQGKVMTASLDHAMWFHAPIDFSNWHLYDLDAPWTGGGRGFNRGKMFAQDGQLVASVAQEGLMRPLEKSDRRAD